MIYEETLLKNEALLVKEPHVSPEDDSIFYEREVPEKKVTSTQETEAPKSALQSPNPKKTNKQRDVRKKVPKLMMCVANTKYEVVKYVGRKLFKFQLTKDEEVDWDLCWQDNSVKPLQLARMKPYKKINHFPGMYNLSRKDYLARNLMLIRKALPDLYDFFPRTWILPTENKEFIKQFDGDTTFILKPDASSQGRGIFLTKKAEDIKPDMNCIGQMYLSEPYLIDGLKFDIRLYVLLYGCNPPRIFLYNEGLVRLATELYKKPSQLNMSKLAMHLTNYAINKHSDKFIFNNDKNKLDIGHKRSLTSLYQYIENKEGAGKVEKVKQEIEDIVIKTICVAQPILSHLYKTCLADDIDDSCCFEILGFDIMLDEYLHPWLLEVNHSPSFSTDTPLDWYIKRGLIADTMTLLHMTVKKKRVYLQKKIEELKKPLAKKTDESTLNAKLKYRVKKYKIRTKYEEANMGNYKLVYPQEETKEKYQVCLEKAKEIYISRLTDKEKADYLEKLARDTKSKSPIASKKPILTSNSFIKFIAIPKIIQSTYSVEPIKKMRLKESECCKIEELPRVNQEHNFMKKITTVSNKLKNPTFFKSSDTLIEDIYPIEKRGISNSSKKSRQQSNARKYLSMIQIVGDNVLPTDNSISRFKSKDSKQIRRVFPINFQRQIKKSSNNASQAMFAIRNEYYVLLIR